MTGRRPDTTKVWEFADHFREVGVGKEWVSMPQFFKQFGYLTLGGGKLFHPSSGTENIGMPFMDWPESWSPEYPYFFPRDDANVTTCADQGPFALPPGSHPHKKFVWCEMEIDKDDNVTFGQLVRDNCVERLELAAANRSRPFFIGCGFHKPHAPHYAPREFYDALPDWREVPLPVDMFAPVGMPTVAWHPYADVSGMVETPQFNGTVNHTRLHVYRRAYYASIAYTDYNIGVIVDKLDATPGLKDTTAVVVFGDHGYQLGEHDTWAKMTNVSPTARDVALLKCCFAEVLLCVLQFELGVHIPLIIRASWISSSVGKETGVLAEMVDMFPTLAELAGLPDPRTVAGSEGINGTSLAPAIADPSNSAALKPAAFSQFSKNNIGTSVACTFFRNATKLMGYTIRTHEWRYTAWFRFSFEGARGPYPTDAPDYFGRVLVDESLGTELCK